MRAARPRRPRPGRKASQIDGLSPRTMAEINRLERSDDGPRAVADALAGWRRLVHRPDLVVCLREEERSPCPCCDPFDARDRLDDVLRRLSPRARNELQAKIQPFDDLYLRRTVPVPRYMVDLPWWRQRA